MAVDRIDLTLDSSSDSANESLIEVAFSHVRNNVSAPRDNFAPMMESPSNRKSPGNGHQSIYRGPISPPPLKRSSASTVSQSDYQVSMPLPVSASPDADPRAPRETTTVPGLGVMDRYSQQMTPPFSSLPPRDRQPAKAATPMAQTPKKPDWNVPKIVASMASFCQDVKDGHAELTAYMIDSTVATERRALSGPDLFAAVIKKPVPEEKGKTMRVKFKQHLTTGRSKKDSKEEHYEVLCIKTNKERVPRYRFHHVEIKKNVLTPNTMLTFVPHLRDLESSEESKYNVWLQELEDIDRKSGFKPTSREGKVLLTRRSERAATVSLYLETWLDRLAIPGCNKSTLIRYMASQEPDDAITPRQKTDILRSHQEGDTSASPGANKAAAMFTEAFHHVFKEEKQIELRDVLLLEESVDSIMDSKPMAKDGSSPQNEDEDDLAEYNLGTYCILGCLICFSHSCEHGEYDASNCKRTFSMIPHLSDTLKRRRQRRLASNGLANGLTNGDVAGNISCERTCYLTSNWPDQPPKRPWTEDERVVLRAVRTTADHSKLKRNPFCLVADILDRDCSDVFSEYERLAIYIPRQEGGVGQARVKNLPWYDRYRKALIGDWQEHTLAHEHQRRELPDPCSHEGPCTAANCSCVKKNALCEKFCGCFVENCAYKFTGCACHSQGKTCHSKQKERPCICVQLNRECDPELCGSCGVQERADPENADDDLLHSTGCQNCVLQRGASKALVLGQSQLEGVGYGLFTAQNISQDEFIVEYVGELITHDEGVRREARRGDVFDEESNISYLFTLLEHEGIWVDAAIYGNLSRYINHAGESDKRGCNITPRIQYVNGEYRIKFTALRDIEAGEELFFNYGENFPNLTKKLLDDKTANSSHPKKRGRKPSRPGNQGVARKAPKAEKKKPGRPKPIRAGSTPGIEDEVAMEDWAQGDVPKPGRKRKRGPKDDSDEEEYHPTGTGTDATGSRTETPSSPDSDGAFGKSPDRLRRRTRVRPKADRATSPSKARGLPKTRGKRGGARPGSGRPRKHPRPAPKVGSEITASVIVSAAAPAAMPVSASASASASTSTSASASTSASVSASASASTIVSAATPATSFQSAPSPAAPTAPTISVAETVTAAVPRPESVSFDTTAPTVVASQLPRPTWHRSGSDSDEIEDSDEGIDDSVAYTPDEDDEDDQDVVIRKRMDRATRNRRPPAKFRDDEFWELGSGSQ